MIEQELKEDVRNPFLGEIETEIVGMQYRKAKIDPGEQVNLEREAKDTHDRRAIRVENGHDEPVGYLPKNMASWLAPLIDSGAKSIWMATCPRISFLPKKRLHAAR